MGKNIINFLLIITCLSISSSATAHIGTGLVATNSFINGFTHPLLGIDHLLAMLAVGLWAGQNQGKTLWVTPISFIIFMIIGGMLGIFKVNLPLVENAILASLIVFGGLIALSIRSNITVAMLLMATFAIFHGHSHGTEMIITDVAFKYISGFVVATGLLHISGIGIAKYLQLDSKANLSKITGSSIITAAVILLLL